MGYTSGSNLQRMWAIKDSRNAGSTVATAKGDATIEVAPALYIVRAGGLTAKGNVR